MKPKNLILHTAGLEVNAEGSLPEWIQLAPYGRHPSRDRKSLQVFDVTSAELLVNAFHGIFRKITRVIGFNTVPIWLGHPDFAPTEWPEKVQLGSITDLAARADGLWGKAEWNTEAEREIRQNRHRFASSAWDVEETGPGIVTPVILWSVGMWHQPNIKSVLPVVNAGVEEEDAEDDEESEKETKPETKTEDETPMNPNIIKLLIEAGLIQEGADQAAIDSALSELLKKRTEEENAKKKAEGDAESYKLEMEKKGTENEALKSEINALKTKAGALVIQGAIETGRITAADKAGYETEINADFEKGVAKLAALPVKLNTKGINITRDRTTVLNAFERTQKVKSWVDDHMAKTGASYDTAFNACKADPAMKPLFDAMEAKA